MGGLVIAAPASGAGKTTVALALIAAARRRGLEVQPFKIGPDFIDPGHHARVAGRPARTLDGWMLGRESCGASFARGVADADLAVVEGMMGLFDGLAAGTDAGSTAEVARWLRLPVLLVVDAGAMARSAAALVRGFRDFDPELTLAGVVLNRVGGEGHLALLRAALASAGGPPCLGGLPVIPELALPERHLGLVTAAETGADTGRLADAAEGHLDVEGALAIAGVSSRSAGAAPEGAPAAPRSPAAGAGWVPPAPRPAATRRPAAAPRVALALARDEAFSFYYPENLELLERAGAVLVPFSPLRDDRLPRGAAGIYLGGGYPELHAERLAANRSLLADLRRFAAGGGQVYAECGGLMLLGTRLTDAGGRAHPMAGVLPFATRVLPRGLTLGYREVTIERGGFLPALVARGHEFHHSALDEATVPASLARLYRVRDPVTGTESREGFAAGRVLASYVHLHFASAPALAPALVAAAREAAAERAPEKGRPG